MLQFFVSLWFKLEVLLYVITMQKKKKKKGLILFFLNAPQDCTTVTCFLIWPGLQACHSHPN